MYDIKGMLIDYAQLMVCAVVAGLLVGIILFLLLGSILLLAGN